MKTNIIRRIETGNHGSFGVMIMDSIPYALTLEREWLNNERSISCIPAGHYMCNRIDSPKFSNTFEVTDVPGRSHILFHKGNLDDDSHGCILVGENFGNVKGSPAIQASKKGYNEFMRILAGDDIFRLIIVDDWKNPIN